MTSTSAGRVGLLALLLLAGAAVATAQPTGPLHGRVLDATGAALPGATVTIVAAAPASVTTVTTDGQGRFRIDALPAGTYDVTVALDGFASAHTATQVTPAQDTPLQIVLVPAGVREAVTVSVARAAVPVTALPNTVTLLDREVLDRQTAVSGDLASVLESSVPGFSASLKKLTGRGETLRGRNPLYTINGVPLHTPLRDGDRDGHAIDLDFVERIEVVHGSNAIQGIGATGGVVNMVTKAPRSDGRWTHDLKVSLGGDAGFADDTLSGKVSYLLGRQVGRLSFVAGASYHKRGMMVDADGTLVGLYATQGDIMDSTTTSLYGKATASLGPHQELAVSASQFTLERDAQFVAVNGNRGQGRLTTSEAGDPRPLVGDPARNDVRTLALEYRHSNLGGGELTAQAFVYDYEALFEGGTFGNFFRLTPDGPPFLDQSAITTEKLGAKVTWAPPSQALGGVRLLTGLDLTRDDSAQVLARSDRAWVPPTVLTDVAPFVQLQRPLSRFVLLSGGARLERAGLRVDDYVTIAAEGNMPVTGGSPSFTEVLPNAGVIVYPAAPLSVYASYNEGFTMPDAGRVLRSVARPGQSVDSLLDIDPIVTGNIEVGGTWNGTRARLHAAYYRSNADRGSLLELSPAGIFNVQRQRTEIEGVDLSFDVPVTDRWTAGALYSWIDGRFDSNRDGRVDTDLDGLNIGSNRLNVFLEGGHGPVTGRLQVSRLFARDFDGPAARPGIRFGGYTVGELSLALTTRAGIVRLGIDNLLDEQYVTYFSQVEPNQGAGTYFAGPGRTLLLTVERRF